MARGVQRLERIRIGAAGGHVRVRVARDRPDRVDLGSVAPHAVAGDTRVVRSGGPRQIDLASRAGRLQVGRRRWVLRVAAAAPGERVGLHVERATELVGRCHGHVRTVHRHQQEMEHPIDRRRRAQAAAGAPVVRRVGPADRGRDGCAAPTDRLERRAAAARDVGHRHAGRRGCAPRVDVRVPVEDDVHAVVREQALELRRGSLQIGVRNLGRVRRVQREMEEGELHHTRMRREVSGEPLILRTRDRPVRRRVVAVEIPSFRRCCSPSSLRGCRSAPDPRRRRTSRSDSSPMTFR